MKAMQQDDDSNEKENKPRVASENDGGNDKPRKPTAVGSGDFDVSKPGSSKWGDLDSIRTPGRRYQC